MYMICNIVIQSIHKIEINGTIANPSVKFKVTRFDETNNFKLWQMKFKDLLAQQNLQKA